MLKSRRSRNVAVAGLLVMSIFAATLCAQSPANNELLKMIPAKSLFCVRVNNLDYTLNQIDQFLAGVSPMPMGISMLVRMQLANLLCSPQLTGLKTDSSFAVFGAAIPGETAQSNAIPNIFVGVLAPVTDYKQFIEGHTNCSGGDEKGISKITMNGMPVMLSAKAGNYALMSWANDYDKLITMSKAISAAKTTGLSGTLDASEIKLAQSEPVWAYGNVQQVSETFGPIITAKINEVKTLMQSAGSMQSGVSPASIQNLMNMYAEILETFLKETKSISISINPKPDALNITKTVSAIPGTDMAKMLTANTSSQENTLLTYLNDGAIANFGATINTSLWKMLNEKGIDLFAAMGGESMSADVIDEFKTLATEISNCLEGPVAYSISNNANSKPPFSLKYVIAVRDEKKFEQIIDKAINMMNTSGIMDFYKNMGIETSFSTQKGVDNYKGVSIDSAKLAFKADGLANSPQAQMINSMYGEGFDYRWGMVNGHFACAVCGDVNSKIRELIDEIKADSAKQIGDEMKNALALLPGADKADFIVTLNALRFFNMVTSMIPIPIPPMDAQTKSNIVIAGKADSGKMTVNMAVPKQHLIEIMSAVMAMQQKSAQQNIGQ